MVHVFECSARPGPEPRTPRSASSCGDGDSRHAATPPRSLKACPSTVLRVAGLAEIAEWQREPSLVTTSEELFG
jgi:hypothetical protein